ncbi:hypothetical protein GF336_03475 [Candidatus Woesearchaeota archaeon]|nr:hypothetical protein [Candidatus Woesearchaeota archaeon]
MLTEKEEILLKHLRLDSRKSLAKISKETNIPVSTLFDLLKRLENKVINKHTSLMDFSKIGYGLKMIFAITTKDKNTMKEFLIKNPSVNTVSSSINNCDFHVECIFKDMKEMSVFKESLEELELTNLEETFIVDELKKEGINI